MGIANLISLLNPEMVVLGGGLMQVADLVIDRIREGVPRWAQPIAASKTAIELSTLGEDAGLLGAARLAFLRTGIHKE
jgi:glucokinase